MFTVGMVRMLKGCPLSIVIVMTLHGQNVNEKWLQAATGYSQNTVRNGLMYLKEVGIIEGINYKYRIASNIKSIPLPLCTSQKMTPTTTAINNINKKVLIRAVEESKIDSRKKMILDFGISEPTASELHELEWTSKEYLESMFTEAKKNKTSVRLIIHKIRCKDKVKILDDQTVESYKVSWLKKNN